MAEEREAVCINEWQINVEHVWNEHGQAQATRGSEAGAGQEQSTRQTTMANGGCSQRRRSFKIFLHSSHTHTQTQQQGHALTHTHGQSCARAYFEACAPIIK